MKRTIFLIAFLASYTLYGQELASKLKVSAGFNFSPDYNFRTINAEEPGYENWENNQIGKFGYTTGVTVLLRLSNRVEVETGLQYANKGYQTKMTDLFFETNPLLPAKARFHYSYHYIGVPLKLNLFFGEGDIRFISGFGATTNILLNVHNRNNFEYADGKKEMTKSKGTNGFNTIDISPMISIGIDYKLTNTMHLRAEPTFRYGVLKTTHSPIKEHLWNAGVNLGLGYQL